MQPNPPLKRRTRRWRKVGQIPADVSVINDDIICIIVQSSIIRQMTIINIVKLFAVTEIKPIIFRPSHNRSIGFSSAFSVRESSSAFSVRELLLLAQFCCEFSLGLGSGGGQLCEGENRENMMLIEMTPAIVTTTPTRHSNEPFVLDIF